MDRYREDGLEPIQWKPLGYLLASFGWSVRFFLVGPESIKQIFHAHRLILAISSTVFQKMLYGETAVKETPIRIPEVHPKIFKALLHYIYTDDLICENYDEAYDLGAAAHKFQIPELVERCINLISENLLSRNGGKAFEIGKIAKKRRLDESSDDSDSN